MFTYTLRRRKNDWGEFVVRCWKDGKRYEPGDYFTDEWADACNTMVRLREAEARRTKTPAN